MNIDTKLCIQVGVSAAIVHAVIKAQCDKHGVPFEGHRFAKLSVKDLSQMIPFLNTRTITRALSKLEQNNLIEGKTFVGTTKWRRAL